MEKEEKEHLLLAVKYVGESILRSEVNVDLMKEYKVQILSEGVHFEMNMSAEGAEKKFREEDEK